MVGKLGENKKLENLELKFSKITKINLKSY